MIKIEVEVTDGTYTTRAAVCAESIRQAVRIAKDRYPGSAVEVVFPIRKASSSKALEAADASTELVRRRTPLRTTGKLLFL